MNRDAKMLDLTLEKIGMRILGKRGESTRQWIRLQKLNDLGPVQVRDSTIMEIFNIIQEFRKKIKEV